MAGVIETRPSYHISDTIRRIYPTNPKVGTIIPLGTGELFVQEVKPGVRCVGVSPLDGRAKDWLNPHALYAAHYQTVRLFFDCISAAFISGRRDLNPRPPEPHAVDAESADVQVRTLAPLFTSVIGR
jgi:hypothetical protein